MKLKLLKRTIFNKVTLWFSYVKLIPILHKLNKDSIVIDCGANIGDITKKFAGTGATVHAFEPDPLAFDLLKKRFEKTPNVILYKKGVWNKETDVILFGHKDQQNHELAYTIGSSIIGNKVNIDPEKKQTIHVIDLSDFIVNLGKKVNVIKLDVEGAETAILRKILTDKTYNLFDKMYVETHETKIPGQSDELKEIKEIIKQQNIQNIKLNWL